MADQRVRTDPADGPADLADPPPRPPAGWRGYRPVAFLRNSWRQLTSMRTALILLFLLAVAAVPGSVLPQRSVNASDVAGYYAEHPDLAPVLDRLGGFDVFSSFWFSAIYVLLFTSLLGCIVPRLRDQVRVLRSAPPPAPRRLDRLPQHASWPAEGTAVAPVAAALRRRRWRVAVREGAVAAEKGYLKESGNLLFHLTLIGLLAGVAFGSWYGWHGNRLVIAGPDHAFCNTLQQYDEYGLGARVGPADLPPFCFELTDFRASYLDTGQPTSFLALATVEQGAGTPRPVEFSVNAPLRLDGANVYLLGHGYAPILRYTDRYGRAQTAPVPFLTLDDQLTSEGVAAFPDANLDPATGRRAPGQQVAFEGLYLPTAPQSPPFVRSVYPAERSPALVLSAYRGDLGLDAGIPSSVYTLDQRQVAAGRLARVGQPQLLRVGETWTLDDGSTLEFLGSRQWVTLSVRHDPGHLVVLVSAGLLLAGLLLSLTGKRRRIWVRVAAGPDGASIVEAGGLPRTDYPGFADEFQRIVRDIRAGGSP